MALSFAAPIPQEIVLCLRLLFPQEKKGINSVVGKRDVLVIEMIPAEQVMGNTIDEIISNTVARQLRLSKERNMRVKIRTAIATAVT